MKNLIKSKIFWFFVVVAAAVGTYFGFENNWWMENVEPVVEAPAETTEDVEVIEAVDSLEVVNDINTNTVETNE